MHCYFSRIRNETSHFVSIVSKFIANRIDVALIISGLDDSWCADRKKADYPRPSLWIYTPSVSLNLATYFTFAIGGPNTPGSDIKAG